MVVKLHRHKRGESTQEGVRIVESGGGGGGVTPSSVEKSRSISTYGCVGIVGRTRRRLAKEAEEARNKGGRPSVIGKTLKACWDICLETVCSIGQNLEDHESGRITK